MRDGEKGPLVVQAAWTLVQARTEGRPSDVAESLVVFRELQGDGSWKHDYLLSNEVQLEPRPGLARVFKSQHRIEECLRRAKREAGLGDYQVRTWEGWHHHQALSIPTCRKFSLLPNSNITAFSCENKILPGTGKCFYRFEIIIIILCTIQLIKCHSFITRIMC